MGCKISFAPQAIADLAEAVRHIAKDDPETAKRIGNALIDRLAILETSRCWARRIPSAPVCANLCPDPTSFTTGCGLKKVAWTSCVTGTERGETWNLRNDDFIATVTQLAGNLKF